jgi:hypothetical protein
MKILSNKRYWLPRAQPVDLQDIRRWSKAEGHEAGFEIFKQRI